MIARVFIPKIVMRFDNASGRHVDAFDTTDAQRFGQLTNVLDFEDNPKFISRLVPKLKQQLADFTHEDYLLAMGDPCLIAACAGIISRKNPTFKMLKWERTLSQYIQVEVSL